MVAIYILSLEGGKYYVGKTNNPIFRLDQHFHNNGSKWTQKYKPLKILEVKNNCDDYDEDKYTLQYMEKYGIDNVRGGSYCEIKLSKEIKLEIQKKLNMTNDRCYKCGKKGHYANTCFPKEDNDIICYRCGKKGHYANTCFPKEDNDIICYRCGKKGHYANKCFSKKDDEYDEYDEYDDEDEDNDIICYRCGKKGHYANKCFSKKDDDWNCCCS